MYFFGKIKFYATRGVGQAGQSPKITNSYVKPSASVSGALWPEQNQLQLNSFKITCMLCPFETYC
jgi:hypothetical protein